MLEKIVTFFSPKHLRNLDSYTFDLLEEKRKVNTTIYFILTGIVLVSIMFVTRFYLEGMQSSKSLLLLPALSLLLILAAYISRFRKNLYFASYLIVVACLVILMIRVPATGGITSSVAIWFTIIPMIATVMISKRVGLIVAFTSSALIFILSLPENFGIQITPLSPAPIVSGVVLIIVVLFLFALIYFFELEREKNLKIIISSEKNLAHTKRLASLGSVSSGLAHEINNPLTVVKGNTDILKFLINKNEIDKEKLLKHLSLVDKNVIRIEAIVSAFRTYSSQDHVSDFSEIKVEDIIKKAIKDARSYAKHLTISLDGSSSTPIMGNKNLLGKVFDNLIINAAYELADSANATLNFEVEQNFQTILIRATDSGPGIHDEIVDKIFEPFFTTKDIGEGLGMGLSLSYNIISVHGGKLYVNRKSKKTQFIVEIPTLNDQALSRGL